jgi:hypothetical protein
MTTNESLIESSIYESTPHDNDSAKFEKKIVSKAVKKIIADN